MKILYLGLLAGGMTIGQSAAMAQLSGEQSPVIIPVPTVQDGTIPAEPIAPVETLEPLFEPVEQPIAPIQNSGSRSVSNDLYFLTRAKNLARQAAIEANGGLASYRPEFSMYGPALQSPFTRNDDGTVTFTIKGGAPGAPQMDQETEILVNDQAVTTVVYNGPPRGNAIGGVVDDSDAFALKALDEDSFIARARNLARQAGISANGGLGVYRPEASMFGPTASAPVVKNEDESVTFTFKGGAPQSLQPTQETAVTVTREGTVTVDFNRSL